YYQFLYAPIVDLGMKRKHWLVLLSALGAACFFFALLFPLRTELRAFIFFMVAGQAFTGLTGACTGGLMATTMPDAMRGRAGGWSNAGNLGGAALGAGVIMLLAGRLPLRALGAVAAAMVFLPSLAILRVAEADRPRRAVVAVFREMF